MTPDGGGGAAHAPRLAPNRIPINQKAYRRHGVREGGEGGVSAGTSLPRQKCARISKQEHVYGTFLGTAWV